MGLEKSATNRLPPTPGGGFIVAKIEEVKFRAFDYLQENRIPASMNKYEAL